MDTSYVICPTTKESFTHSFVDEYEIGDVIKHNGKHYEVIDWEIEFFPRDGTTVVVKPLAEG